MTKRLVVLLGVLAAGSGQLAWAQPQGDYGDAPPPYPSLHGSGGPHHLDVTREWIGEGTSSTTSNEIDSSQIDLDFDDGRNVFGVSVDADTGETFNSFSTVIAFDAMLSSATDGTRYVNVLVDLDDSGSWDGGKEWLVQNVVLPFDELPVDIHKLTVVVGLDQSVALNTYKDHWARVTLSTVAVPDGVGAWGVFARGETEDFLVDEVADGDTGGPGPSLLVMLPKVARVVRNFAVTARYRHPSGLASGFDGPGDPDGTVSFKVPLWAGSKWWMQVTHVWDRAPGKTYAGDIKFPDPNFPLVTLPLPVAGGAPWDTGRPWKGHTGGTITGYVYGEFPPNFAPPPPPPKLPGRTLFNYRAQVVFDPDNEWILVSTEVDETLEEPPAEEVPAISTWGMVVLGALLLAAIAIKFGRRRGSARAA